MDRRRPRMPSRTSPSSPPPMAVFPTERITQHRTATLPRLEPSRSVPMLPRTVYRNERRVRPVSHQPQVQVELMEDKYYGSDETTLHSYPRSRSAYSTNRNSIMSQPESPLFPNALAASFRRESAGNTRHGNQVRPNQNSLEGAPTYGGFVGNGHLPEFLGGTIEGPPPGAPSEFPKMSIWREVLFVAICTASNLMTQAAFGQALVPMKIIGEDLGKPEPGEMSWFVSAFSLTVGTFIMTSGRLGDIFGHRRLFVFGYQWLGVWSILAGFSVYTGSQIFFDVCRAMQGIGPAMLLPNALALIGRTYPKTSWKKKAVFSIFGCVAPLGFVLGAVFGSLFAEKVSWPVEFWTYGITAMGLGLLATIIIPQSLSLQKEKRPSFDWAGAVTVVAGLVLINVAFNTAPLSGWKSPNVYWSLILGLVLIMAFVWIELHEDNPIIPIRDFNVTVSCVLGLVGIGWGSFGIWVYYMTKFLLEIRKHTPLSVAAQFSPAVGFGVVAAALTGCLLMSTPVSFVMMISMLAFFMGNLLTCLQTTNGSYWGLTFVAIVVMPFGMDMSFPAATFILSNHMSPEHQGSGASLVTTVVNYSISIALGVAGTVEVLAPHETGVAGDFQAIRNAMYCAVALSGLGVFCSVVSFAHSMAKEGWVVKDLE